MNRTKHSLVLSVLERRALRYRNKNKLTQSIYSTTKIDNNIDETGTVEVGGLMADERESVEERNAREILQEEIEAVASVDEEILKVHGRVPGEKREGTVRLLYENMNGINNRMAENEKLEKARMLIDELEADVVCYNEHRLNLKHKDNKNGFAQMFNGGEMEVRAVAAHNAHNIQEAGRVQEGGTAMLLYGQLIEQYDLEESGRDSLGLGRWVVMVFRGANGLTTRVICGYNPCVNKNEVSRTTYQQQRRYYLLQENDDTCPRTRFREDLVEQLKEWREQGDRLIVCLDANEHVYRKSIGKALTEADGLDMSEVVGDFTGKRLGATYFRGSKPIDAIWATKDIEVTGASVMPAGYGIGDHRLFVVDFRLESLIGHAPPKIVRAASRRLNTKIPRIAAAYTSKLEEKAVEHRLNSRLIKAERECATGGDLRKELEKIDAESKQYMLHAEKKCRKMKSGRIPFSPEASVWIRRRQAYESLLKLKDRRIRNKSNCKRAALRCGIDRPLSLTRVEIVSRLEVCEEQCKYFERHGHRYRRKHLQHRLEVARKKRNRQAEEQILAIIQREKERSFWRRLNFSMARSKGRSVREVKVRMEDGRAKVVSSQTEVEKSIWSVIHDKRFHLAERAPICQGRLRGQFGYMGNTKAAEAVLEGTYEYEEGMHQGTAELLQECANIRQIVPKNSVETVITGSQWSEAWRKKKERTSSSESGLHFGHYIAAANSQLVSHHHALKTSICLKHGISLSRWGRGLSVMLEKEANNNYIDKLRAILLMEADFNASNKTIFGSRMMDNARKYGLMQEEIYSEAGKTAEDGALAKQLFYDITRQSRLSAAVSSVDASNCYDSIAHAIASLVFQSFGVPTGGIEAMLSAIQDMKYFLRTAYGDSRSCAQSKIEVKYQGLCQGNGAAPAGWAVISITILRAHKSKGHGATFLCPISQVKSKLAAVLFVDDTDVVHIDMENKEDVSTTHEKMQLSILNWGDLLIGSGGAYNPKKCFYYLMSFNFDRNGKWSYASNEDKEEYEMVVPMPDGQECKIDHLSVGTSKETLGVWTAPNGSPQGALTAMREKADEWVAKAKEGSLRRRDIWFLLDCQFWPRVGYGLSVCTAGHDLLESCLKKQYWQLIPLGGVIRTAPAAIRQLSRGFFGVGCPHVGIECLIGQVQKLLMHFGCPSNVGMKLKVSLEQLIVEVGVSNQPLQENFEHFRSRVTWCWLVSLWEKCTKYGVKVIFSGVGLKPPRERDSWFRRELERVGYTGGVLDRLERVRCYQQVVFTSDIIGISGRSLDERYLRPRPENENWSTLKFPTERPPAKDFRLWAQALRQIVPAGGLRTHLGRFLHKGYKVWEWRVAIPQQVLLRYRDGVMDVYEPSNNTARRWRRVEEGTEPLHLGKPCSVQEMSRNLVRIQMVAPAHDVEIPPETIFDVLKEWGQTWMWKSLKVVGDEHWVYDAIREGTLIAVTDGSYIRERFPNVCSCAFVLECTRGRGRILGSFPEQSRAANAYRGELLGLLAIHLILLSINRIASQLPGSTVIYSDCLGALTKVTSLPASRLPSGCKHSDILKNILVNCSDLSFSIEYRHVKAHQDDKLGYHKLPRHSQLNCCMDTNAKNEIWGLDAEELPIQEMLPLEPVAVFVGKEKITSGSEDNLRFWCHHKLARRVMAEEKVSVMQPEEFDEVAWRQVYDAQHEVPRLFSLWACKQVMGVAGTNEMQARYTPNHDKMCPSCGVRVETCCHVLTCDEEGRVDLLHKSIALVDRWMKDSGTVPKLRRVLVEYMHGRGGQSMLSIVEDRTGPYVTLARSIDAIGWRRLMEGMISKEVVEIQSKSQDSEYHRMSLDKWGSQLVTKLMEVTHGQWLYRNVHVHDIVAGELATKRKEEIRRELEDQMELGGEGLAEEDLYLLDINLDSLESSTGEDQAYWLIALRAARIWQQIQRERHSGIGHRQPD